MHKTPPKSNSDISLFIFLFVLIQLFIPIRYYLFEEDYMNENYSWRMFSHLQLAGKDLDIIWFPKWASKEHKGIKVDLTDHFTNIWRIRLEIGPKWVLKRACEYLCLQIEDAKEVQYIWTIYRWEGGDPRVISEKIQCI